MDNILSMNNFIFNKKTPLEILKLISENSRKRRKESGLSQIELALKSGVSLGSVKRFENKAQISLVSLLKIAIALDCADDFDSLFSQEKFLSIEQIIKNKKGKHGK